MSKKIDLAQKYYKLFEDYEKISKIQDPDLALLKIKSLSLRAKELEQDSRVIIKEKGANIHVILYNE